MQLFEGILHIDKHLMVITNEYAGLTYLFLFLILFCETGVVIMPFLPGDSLLFAAGALAATGAFDIGLLFAVLFIAVVLGDSVNYFLGKFIGPKVFKKESSWFFRKEYLLQAEAFYEKHGKKTIIFARFLPIIRTFAPFVAGIGAMPYRTFLFFSILGTTLWCTTFVIGGYLFGNIPWVKERFGLLVMAIIIVSIFPLAKEVVSHMISKRKNRTT